MVKMTLHVVTNGESTSVHLEFTDMPGDSEIQRTYLWYALREIASELTLEYAEVMRDDARAPPDEEQFEHADMLTEIARTAEQEVTKREEEN